MRKKIFSNRKICILESLDYYYGNVHDYVQWDDLDDYSHSQWANYIENIYHNKLIPGDIVSFDDANAPWYLHGDAIKIEELGLFLGFNDDCEFSIFWSNSGLKKYFDEIEICQLKKINTSLTCSASLSITRDTLITSKIAEFLAWKTNENW